MIGITHNQFIKLFSDIAINHRDINSFYTGDLDNYTANQSNALNPVTLWVVINDDTITGKTDKPRYDFIVLDWVNQDSSNLDEVYSDTLRISKDVLALLRQPYYESFFKVQEDVTFTPFNEKFDSDVAGWQFSLVFDQPFIYDACEVNTTGLPTINYDTLAINSSTYAWGRITGTLNNQTDLQAALDAKVPTSRTLTINGTTYDLSANRSWTIPTGGNETLAQTLALGNTTGANNISVNDDQYVLFGSTNQGAIRYNSAGQKVTIANTSGGQSIELLDTGGIYLSPTTASRVLITDANGNVSSSTMPESYLDATSSIQTQLDAKVPKTYLAAPTVGTIGYVPNKYFMRQHAPYVLSNSSSPQQLFNGTANGAITLPIGTYKFTCQIYLSAMSTTSGNSSFSFVSGTAVTTNFFMHVMGYDNAPVTTTINQNGQTAITSAFGTNMHTASVSASQVSYISGSFEVTTAGTIIPSIALTHAIATAQVNIGSYIEIECLGLDTVTYAGPWS